MKRHPSLAHFSREHHGALILARLLQKDAPPYKSLPVDIDGKVKYALKFYREDLIKHFDEEEKAFTLAKEQDATLDLMIRVIIEEHRQLHDIFASFANGPVTPDMLDDLGKTLEAHIRKEERQLFPLIEKICGEKIMQAIEIIHQPASNQLQTDLQNRNDIELLVNRFYEKVKADKELGHIFQEMVKVNWPAHLATMYSFWENIILFTGGYEGNPMNLHKHLHHIAPLSETHFNTWNNLFIATVDELFKGEKAALAKQRALSISLIIKEKLLAYHQQK